MFGTASQAATTNYFNSGGVTNIVGDFIVSSSVANNRSYVEVSNGTTLTNSGEGGISYGGATVSNTVVVTGNGSAWNHGGNLSISYIGTVGSLIITNGGSVRTAGIGYIGRYPGYGLNDLVKVTGVGSTWRVGGGLFVGAGGVGDLLLIEQGGTVTNNGSSGIIGQSYSNNTLYVDGAGSAYVQNSGSLYVGFSQGNNQLIITNGGKVVTANAQVTYGVFTPGSGNHAIVTGMGSLWTNTGSIVLGGYTGSSNVVNSLTIQDSAKVYSTSLVAGSGTDSNQVLITSGGMLQANTLSIGVVAGFTHNFINNNGGIFQFTTGTPSLSPGLGTISVTDGTVSFSGVASAPVTGLTGMRYYGDNTFRIYNSSNTAIGTYGFDSVANTGNPTNYQRLTLMGNSAWRGANLNFGTGGNLLVSNSTSTINAALVSSGSILVVNSKITYASNVVVHGSYVSDPSTNTFLQNLTVTPSGSLAGGVGDVFDFKKSFYNQSTNSSAFNLAASTVSFTGGGIHTNSVTGADMGHDATHGFANGFVSTNFGYGRLTLGSTNDIMYFTGGNGAASNAVYITHLDISGLTNSYANITDMITNLFHSPTSVNIYYAESVVTGLNSWLNDQVFQLSDLGGGLGGFLMPAIPEPSAILMVTAGLGLLIRRKAYRA